MSKIRQAAHKEMMAATSTSSTSFHVPNENGSSSENKMKDLSDTDCVTTSAQSSNTFRSHHGTLEPIVEEAIEKKTCTVFILYKRSNCSEHKTTFNSTHC